MPNNLSLHSHFLSRQLPCKWYGCYLPSYWYITLAPAKLLSDTYETWGNKIQMRGNFVNGISPFFADNIDRRWDNLMVFSPSNIIRLVDHRGTIRVNLHVGVWTAYIQSWAGNCNKVYIVSSSLSFSDSYYSLLTTWILKCFQFTSGYINFPLSKIKIRVVTIIYTQNGEFTHTPS